MKKTKIHEVFFRWKNRKSVIFFGHVIFKLSDNLPIKWIFNFFFRNLQFTLEKTTIIEVFFGEKTENQLFFFTVAFVFDFFYSEWAVFCKFTVLLQKPLKWSYFKVFYFQFTIVMKVLVWHRKSYFF
jgi:hypothetical protein